MLLIYLPKITARCVYVFELIFKERFAIKYRLTTNLQEFEEYKNEKLNYSQSRINSELYICSSTILFEQEIKPFDISITKRFETIVLFSNDKSCDVGFDIFAAVFYMISRYEEYLPYKSDKYGRFKSTDSIASKHNFLQQPVADIWINIFKEKLIKRFPQLQFKAPSFKYIVTYDIDVAYAYKGRNVLRTLSSTFKDVIQLNFKNIFDRIQTLANTKKDPWDVYDFLQEIIVKNEMPSVFFFLLSDYSVHDKNLSHTNPLMARLISKISSFSEIGIHPSFKSSALPEKFLIEKKRLEDLSKKQIIKSRQHYLKLKLPDTYNHLIDAGIKEDYTMAFSDMPGFRAGTCNPFYFYDLKKETSTDLKIFPVTFMEGTFMDYMKSTPANALRDILGLIDEVKKVNGTFISLWHNHTISETNLYKDWKNVHDKMIEQILSYA